MELRNLPQRVDRLAGFDALLSACAAPGGRAQVEGLTGPAKSLFLARLHQRLNARTLVVTHQVEQAQRLWDDLRAFGLPESRLCLLPASESRWHVRDATDYRVVGERIGALCALAAPAPGVVIGTAEAVLQPTAPLEDLVGHIMRIEAGARVDLDALTERLVDLGYQADTTVSGPGQFARRGGILDVFPSTADVPVRIELFGDDIERMQPFDVGTQRSSGAVPWVTIAPARELRLTPQRIDAAMERLRAAVDARKRELAAARDRAAFDTLAARAADDLERIEQGAYFDGLEEYLPYLAPDAPCALDYLARGDTPSLVVIDEPGLVRAHSERLREELDEARQRRFDRGEALSAAPARESVAQGLARIGRTFRTAVFTHIPRTYEGLATPHVLQVSTSQVDSYRARLSEMADEVRIWMSNGAACLVVSDQPQRVRQICRELDLPARGAGEAGEDGLTVLEGRLRQGMKFADVGLFVVTDAELFGLSRLPAARKGASGGIPISTILDLRVNDYVVHVNHGIGVYRGMVKRQVEGTERDYLHVQYRDGSLYVPADQIDRLQRYIGGDGSPPAVHSIAGKEWERTTRRAKEQTREMAAELISLYAARQAAERPSFGEDTIWQAEMEAAFPYDETPSQLRAIAEVKDDLELGRPMDRLICGDVGYGKTEVAIRAAFKVIEGGKQVAVLCPTTVLAAQHHTTFSERLAAYPIRVELLSRYRSRREQKQTAEDTANGSVDIVIGTHRLLSKDVQFQRLGLVIVDEEQRFGVAHKERLKQLRKTVDVLTLTATPIPRTLSMALSGLRDMSTIEDPPSGRRPIVTYVHEYDEDIVRDSILRELARDGQVYFVHNRVETIEHVALRLRRLVPDARIRIGHGQMSEDELERIMLDFYHRESDVLLCTTIIENGLDVPNVNTIIIDHADKLGLAQLYQLRGRVGRSSRQAYAYLFYPPSRQLSEEADRRLMAIREFTALGSGFQVAMRDLEIRGAGNLLGPEQSGAMVSVGFDLYCRLLAETVAELKGEEQEEDTLPPADLPVTAHIPNQYIPREAERIFFYKRMSNVRSPADVDALREELEDRYGDPPKPVWNALAVLRLRLRARAADIVSIRGETTRITFRFGSRARLSAGAIRKLTLLYRKRIQFTGDSISVALAAPRVLEETEDMLGVLEQALTE